MSKLTNKEEIMKADNIKDGKRVPVMHGENWFTPVAKLPKGDIKTARIYIAGHSETGHHHVIESKQDMQIVEGEQRGVLINEVSRLFHQKTHDVHETINLAPGAYIIGHKTEYDPFQKVIREVWD